jgi:hypothetical protein
VRWTTLRVFPALLVATAVLAQGPALTNWPAPPTYARERSQGLHVQGDTGGPVPFIPIAPCRQYDSRGTDLKRNSII